jgi:uroporphyrinogen decarboxylase
MNSKERVNTALRRSGIPDRVPVQFDLCRPLLQEFSEKYHIPIKMSPSYYEDLMYRTSANDLRTAMGSDCVIVGGGLPSGYIHPTTADGCIINEFGMKMRQGLYYMDVVQSPFAEISSPAEVQAFQFPDAYAPGRFVTAARDIETYKNDYFIIGDVELTMFEMAWHMVGLEKFMLDMASHVAYIEPLLDKAMEFSIGIAKQLAGLGVDGLWFGDDFGAQNGMMISPKMWRTIFKPRFAEVFQEVRLVNPNLLVMYHCDGAISPILNDLIEIGLDVLNPVQPNVPGHEPQDLKTKFGDRLSFWGAIDQQYVLPQGTANEIEQDVAEKIQILGANGGYMCSPAHILQADTPLENIETFLGAVLKHGVY